MNCFGAGIDQFVTYRRILGPRWYQSPAKANEANFVIVNESGNLLTGALYVAFDFHPDAPPATVDWAKDPVELPTLPGELQVMEASVASILRKVDQLPFKAIGDDLRKAISDLDLTLGSARGVLDNANKMVEPSSPLGAELGGTLEEVKRAARGLRVLLDYLERHPEALIRGKTGEAK